jgi:hypothetical protein
MYWPWWAGALGLGAVAIGYCTAARVPLGVSGLLDRVIHWRESAGIDESYKTMEREEAELAAMLLEATRAEVQAQVDAGTLDRSALDAPALQPGAFGAETGGAAVVSPSPVWLQAGFLAAVLAGGLLAAIVAGRFSLRWTLGVTYGQLFGDGPVAWMAMLLGGALVGFGAAMAGGCTSGHGLSGCGRGKPGSLVATGAFMAAGIATSVLLERLVR